MTIGELARLFNGESADRRGPDRRADEELAARRLVRRHRPGVGEPVAEHAQHGRGDALSGHRRDRRHEHLGRPRHRHAVRADRRAVDRRPGAGGGAQRARAAGRPLLSGDVHAGGRREARRPGVPRRVRDRHRSRSAAAGARRPARSRRRCRGCTARSSSWRTRRTLFGSKAMLEKIRAGDDPAAIAASWAADEAKWRLTRAKYLLY